MLGFRAARPGTLKGKHTHPCLCDADAKQMRMDVVHTVALRLALCLRGAVPKATLSAILQQDKESKVIKPEVRALLPKDARQAVALLERSCRGLPLFKYHCCSNQKCPVIYRRRWQDLDKCPRCGTPRYRPVTKPGKRPLPQKVLYYISILDYIEKVLFGIPSLAARLGWPDDPARRGNAPASTLLDVHDGKLFKEVLQFCPLLREVTSEQTGCPVRLITLALCIDSISPGKVHARGYDPALLQCLQLPVEERNKLENMLLACIMPGDKAGVDLQPMVEILADEARFLYHVGMNVADSSKPEQPNVHVRGIILDGRFDLPGHAAVMRTPGGNPYWGGCPVCLTPGLHDGSKVIYPCK